MKPAEIQVPLHGLASDDVPIGGVAPAETADGQALGSKESSASAVVSPNCSRAWRLVLIHQLIANQTLM